MAIRTRTRTAAIATAAMLAAAPAAAVAAESNNHQDGAQPLPRVQHLRTVTTTPASGEFRCGRLHLTITHGTETEVFEGLETRGVTFIDIYRRWNHVRLTGSNGRVYRTEGIVTREKAVLVAPDDENPVWVTEIIQLRFHNRHVGSPGYLREVIKIRNGVRTDVVTGPCAFG